MMAFRRAALIWLLALCPGQALAESDALAREVRITVLSTMLTEFQGVGEWGFAALVEVDGRAILFDTGARPDTVLHNAAELGVDLSAVSDVVISHNHWDHTGGLVTLRRELRGRNPEAMRTAHGGKGIFLQRELDPAASRAMSTLPAEFLVDVHTVRSEFEALGGRFVVHEGPYQLQPGVWVSGPVPRVHPEKNWTPFSKIRLGDSLSEDTIPEDQALFIATERGTLVLTGCGHAGIVNIMEYARKVAPGDHLLSVMGGFHLLSAKPEQVQWTAQKMKAFGISSVLGAHCTGINPVADLRTAGDFDRQSVVVGSVGATYTLGAGIRHGPLTR